MKTRLAVFATHPIQYQVPIWRTLAETSWLDVVVYYFSDRSVRGGLDEDFGVPVVWDIPLLDGYKSVFVARNTKLRQNMNIKMRDAKNLLREGKYQCVFLQGYMHVFERHLISAAKSLGIKVIMRGEFSSTKQNRGILKTYLRRQYLKWFYSHIDAFCYIGTNAKKHLEAFDIPEKKLFFSPYCVDTAHFLAQSSEYNRASTRQQLGLADNHCTFLFSGKLIPRKEILLLLDALEQLPCNDNVALIVLGDGPQRAKVIKRGNNLLGSRFLFKGFVNQTKLGQYFLASDVFVLPSYYETWGLVVNEAMQFGLPVIVSDMVGCYPDLVPDGITGFVFPSGNSSALAYCMQRLIQNPKLSQQLGARALHRISGFTVQSAVDGILEAIAIGAQESCKSVTTTN